MVIVFFVTSRGSPGACIRHPAVVLPVRLSILPDLFFLSFHIRYAFQWFLTSSCYCCLFVAMAESIGSSRKSWIKLLNTYDYFYTISSDGIF
ncbi:MAG: hypothetical protein ACTSWN_00400 [Promethearchaeota archaeon]